MGSSQLVRECESGNKEVDAESFWRLGKQFTDLIHDGYGLAVVSSGAMAVGQVVTGSHERLDRTNPADWARLQRFAGIGWGHILLCWADATCGTTNASMLLTRTALDAGEDTRTEALSTVRQHMVHRDLLIVNENDAIAHEEIAYGDNDILAAIFAKHVAVSTGVPTHLVMLTDTNGVYADINDPGTQIPVIDDIEAFRRVLTADGEGFGLGSMDSKFDAELIAGPAGVKTVIANGREENVLAQAIAGQTGTRFSVTY